VQTHVESRPRSSRYQQAGFALTVQARQGRPRGDWEFSYTAAPSCLAVVWQLLWPAPQPVPKVSSRGMPRCVAVSAASCLSGWWVAFYLGAWHGGCPSCLSLKVYGGATYGAGNLVGVAPNTVLFLPWRSSLSRAAYTNVSRCNFEALPVLELTLPKGELPRPCDRRPEGVPKGPPNRRVKVRDHGGDFL